MGVTIFIDWEDIVEVNSRLLFMFLASLYQDLFLKYSNVKTTIEPKTSINSLEETSSKEISKLKLELEKEKIKNKELNKKIITLAQELEVEKI